MRHFILPFVVGFLAAVGANAQSDRDFSGSWKLKPSKSELHPSVPAESSFRAEQTALALTVYMQSPEDAATLTLVYPLNGKAEKRKAGDFLRNTETKWEGSALLANTIVSGPRNYTLMERWKRSNDGRSLTIKRTIVRGAGEVEALLVYENALAAPPPPPKSERPLELTTRPAPTSPEDFVVTAGTRVLLHLTNAVNTKHTAPGDRIYLETAVPVYVKGKLVIPQGSHVSGTVTASKQAGRVKGTSAMSLEFDSLQRRNARSEIPPRQRRRPRESRAHRRPHRRRARQGRRRR
jgi:hypothetical protein